jgi:hypothetical protein
MRNVSLFLFTFLIISCKSKVDITEEDKAIRKLLKQERDAHFSNDVNRFVAEFADSMISVNKGKVKIFTPEENKKRIEPYFKSVQFIKWDDVEEPVIKFSDDGSLAYAVVQKQVILTYPDSLGKPFIDTSDYGWVSIYRKNKTGWKVETNISTNK